MTTDAKLRALCAGLKGYGPDINAVREALLLALDVVEAAEGPFLNHAECCVRWLVPPKPCTCGFTALREKLAALRAQFPKEKT